MPRTSKRIYRTLGTIIVVPLLLVCAIVVAAYYPPIQRWLVNEVGSRMEESLGMRVSVEDVRITPFLNLEARGIDAVDLEGDTLIAARTLNLDVALLPLFVGRADIDGFQLLQTRLNTKSLIPDCSVVGRVGQLTADAHGIEWTPELVRITDADLSDADLYVCLTDTAAKDTTSQLKWIIDVDRATIANTRLHATLPPDSTGTAMGVDAFVRNAKMADGHFDLGRPLYAFRQLQLLDSRASVVSSNAVPYAFDVPVDTLINTRHLAATIDSLSYDENGVLRCGLTHVGFDELHYGLRIREIAGALLLDKDHVEMPALNFHTPYSRINAGIDIPWTALADSDFAAMKVDVNAALGNEDIKDFLRIAVQQGVIEPSLLANSYLKPFLASDVNVQAELRGNLSRIIVDDYNLIMRSHPLGAQLLAARGNITLSDNFQAFSGRINADVNTANVDLRRMLTATLAEMDASLPKNEFISPFLSADVHLQADFRGTMQHIVIPAYNVSAKSSPLGRPLLAARGDLDVNDDFQAFSGHINTDILGGNVAGQFATHLKRETYDVSANITRMPLDRFLSGYDIRPFSGRVEARGTGFSPTAVRSNLTGRVDAQRLLVMGYDLSGLKADVALRGGKALANINLHNYLGNIKGNVEAALGRNYDATAQLKLDDLNMHALAGASEGLLLSTVLDVHATASEDFRRMTAQGSLHNNFIQSPRRSAELKDLSFDLATAPQRTTADVDAGDLCLNAAFEGDLDYISRSASHFSKVFMAQLENKAVDQEALRAAMPTASLQLHSGTDNPLYNYLRFQGTEVSAIDLDLTSNSTSGINGTANVGRVLMGNLQLDTLYADIIHDAEGIKLCATLDNYRKDNPHRFRAQADARLQERGFDAKMLFKDEKGKTGIDLGVKAETYQGTARFTLYPQNPVFAYRSFTINDDNFISFDRQGVIRGDVHLVADDGTGLLIYSEPTDEKTNDVTLSVYNLNLGELSDVLPYMPRLSGTLNGDFHVIEEHGEDVDPESDNFLASHNLSAMGTVEAKNFAYEGTAIGDLGAELVYLPKENGEHYADAFVSYNGQEVGECSGVYYDTNGHFKGDVALNDFPLQMVNSFLEGTDFMMRGSVGGNFSASGSIDQPIMNGELTFSDAHFYSPVYGVDFQMEERPIVFADSHLEFQDYLLTSGKTDLKVNGNVSMADLSRIHVDLGMKAQNFELINAVRMPSSLVFGRMMANFNGTVRGLIDNLAIRGQVDILPSTDLTYLLTNSPLTVDDRLSDLVTFMDFNDTTTVVIPEEISEMLYDLTLGINIADGAKFHCFLSSNGKSYVDIQGGGNLTLRTTQEGDMNLFGRYTIQDGKMNYELPVIPMKTFQLAQGSTVEWTGEMLNPRLNIQATQNAKAVVADDAGQRNVNFIVGVDITRTLEDMGLAFTIEAPEDLSVQNQLATMSEEDRYKTAVALLATGMYVTENLTTGLKASNALNAFLQNEIQNIAGKALSTFDLSFGMENGTSSAGTTTTDYSFKFSKRFLDDRFSINIGGSVSTGRNAQNSAASFIDNISIEYRLDNSSTRYVSVFYDRDSHDPLEGSMMKTGAGLVLRRKTDRLGELFLFRKK